jgi:hypothetical protein
MSKVRRPTSLYSGILPVSSFSVKPLLHADDITMLLARKL